MAAAKKPSRGKSGTKGTAKGTATNARRRQQLGDLMEGAAEAVVKRKPGRPSSFRPEFERVARFLYQRGATDAEVAEALGVSEQTINAWKRAHPEFLESLRDGKREADDRVERALFERATGYSHEAVKIITVSDGNNMGSHVEQIPYTEHYPPDTTAAIFWLKNRRPGAWRDKQELEHSASESLAALIQQSWEHGG